MENKGKLILTIMLDLNLSNDISTILKPREFQSINMIFTFCFIVLYLFIGPENIQDWSYCLISYFISFGASILFHNS